jgi:peptidoglycan-associated lipoprotein
VAYLVSRTRSSGFVESLTFQAAYPGKSPASSPRVIYPGMKLLTSIMLAAALAAIPACGKKAKPATGPGDTTEGSGDSAGKKGATTKGDTGTGDGQGAGTALGEIIYFEFDDSSLSADAKATLEENAKWLKEDGARTLLIEGHTDEVGTAEYNVALGERRAKAAKDYLVALGIDAGRLRILSFGEEKPAGPEDAKNRRSVFIATKK